MVLMMVLMDPVVLLLMALQLSIMLDLLPIRVRWMMKSVQLLDISHQIHLLLIHRDRHHRLADLQYH
jgi:hypothetical protein